MSDTKKVGRIYVLGIEETQNKTHVVENHGPLMLLALNSTDAVEWKELETKVRSLFHLVDYIN
jgi:hypothetical protein